MTSITKSKGTESIKLKKPNWIEAFSRRRVPKTSRSAFAFEIDDSDVEKETSDFIEKHRKAFESLAKK